jgi:hypothetical protein
VIVDWIATTLSTPNLAAGSSTGQVPIWVAGLFAIGGAAVTLSVQVVSNHNSNRRQDGLSVLNNLTEFIAAGHTVIRALPAGDLDTAGTKEAFDRIENAYAALILLRPALHTDLATIRENIAKFVDEGPRNDVTRNALHQDLETLTHKARRMMFIPVTGLRQG